MTSLLKRSLVCIAMPVLVGCAGATVNGGPVGSGTSGSGGTTTGAGGTVTLTPGEVVTSPTTEKAPEPCPDPNACTDFPVDPVFADGAPANSPTLFSGDPSGAGPCVVEPEDKAMYPYNWLRPRFRWTGASGLTQITITTPKQKNPYVIYTKSDSWKMDKDVWKKLAAHIRGEDITVQIRPQSGGASSITFQVAPAGASGSIVYWAADPSTVGKEPKNALDADSMLMGFSVGEEGVVETLKLSQVKQISLEQSFAKRPPSGAPKCMGCHVATPDPGYIAFVDHWPWNTVISGIKTDNVGVSLPDLTEGGRADLNKPWSGMPTFSKAGWQTGKRLMVSTSAQTIDTQPWSTDNLKPAKLVWFNLDSPTPAQKTGDGYFAESGSNYGEIARTGDSNGAAFPTWSQDGSTIVYCSTKGGNQDGRLEKGATDLYSVPFNDGKGGAAKPIPGASEAAYEEYYPAFSPDGKFILYDRIPAGGRMYANPLAEMYVIPAQGGTATHLVSNDPPACSGKKSPGINNHFPRWSPAVKSFEGKNYYWFIFSSNRMGLPSVTYKMEYNGQSATCEVSQLYLSLIVEEDGKLTSYPAIYLWNQSTTKVNTTPVWDVLEIPPVKIF